MFTKKIFRENVYQQEATATITACTTDGDYCRVELDQTIFFPTGGGQSCDRGTISGAPVVDVYEEGDSIIHKIPKSLRDSWQVGEEVNLVLDWEHRFDNMQRHCGEHILTGMFYQLYRGTNKGFHMGDDYMTIDISLDDSPDYDTLTWDMVKEAEHLANDAIWRNVPVTTLHFDTKKETKDLPVRKPVTIDRDITIVCVGSTENPADCVACCGTHPSTSGQVGLIKAYKVESNKGMYRVYFEAGRRAFRKYQKEYDILQTLSTSVSAGEDDIIEKFTTQQEKNRDIRSQLHFLKKEVLAREVSFIKESIGSSLNPDEKETVRRYEILSTDDLASIGREIGPCTQKIFFLVHSPSNTVFLVSDGKIDCGKLVKENAAIYGGKGGGNRSLARAIFTKEEYVDVFIDLIEKHLR